MLSDFCVRDTLLYLTQSLSGPNDTFKIYSIASPSNVYLLGSCRDSGDAVTVTNNAAFLADRWGLYSIDVSDPRNPHKVGTYPGMPISVEARGNICCVTFGNPNDPGWLEFDVLDVSNPASMQRLGYLSDAGGSDMMLDGALVFLSGYFQGSHEFKIVSLADSTQPVALGQCATPGENFGVWGDSSRGFASVADRTEGLAVIDVHSLTAPTYNRALMVAGVARDVSVDWDFCYVASLDAGMKILDVTAPSLPTEVGALDTVSTGLATFSVVARDSFAYLSWWPQPYLRVASVADPANPRIVAGVSVFDFPRDMVLRDSLLYVAQSYKFQVVNVARPRVPVLMGSCVLPDAPYEMVAKDTLAFAATGVSGLQIVAVASPDSPAVVGEFTPPNGACGVVVVDTFAYVASGNLYIASVAEPSSPYLIDSMVLPTFGLSVAVTDTLLFIGSGSVYGRPGSDIRLFDIRDRVRPVFIGSLGAPDMVRRLAWVEPHLYAACSDAGVLIAETAAVGLQEPDRVARPQRELRLMPNPAGNVAHVWFGAALAGGGVLHLFDVSGRQVLERQVGKEAESIELKLNGLGPGLYFVRVETKTGVLSSKIVRQ